MSYKVDDFKDGFHNTATSFMGNDKENEDYFSRPNTMPPKDSRTTPPLDFDSQFADPYRNDYNNQYGGSYNNQYNSQYGNSYNNQYGNQYGNSYNNQYDNQYGNSYNNQYGNQNGNSYNNQYGNQNGNSYNNQYGNQNGNNYNNQYDNQYGNSYNNQYGNQNGNNYNNQYDNQYGNSYNNQYDNQYGNSYNNQYDNQYGNNYNNQYDNQYGNNYNEDMYFQKPTTVKNVINLDTKVFRNKKQKKNPFSVVFVPWIVLSLVMLIAFLGVRPLWSLIVASQLLFGVFLFLLSSSKYDINNVTFCIASLCSACMTTLLTIWFKVFAYENEQLLLAFMSKNIVQGILLIVSMTMFIYGILIGYIKMARCKYETEATVAFTAVGNTSVSEYSINRELNKGGKPIFEYEVNGEIYKRTYDCVGIFPRTKFKVNSVHTLHVNEDNPEEIYISKAENNYLYSVLGVIIFIATMFLYVVL